ncbi:MAG: MATE family efflux transporter [Clostridiales bacterium]|nr:MATE family efflux transporter [Clostridiales bacterium]
MGNLLNRIYGVERLLPKSGVLGEVPATRDAYRELLRIALPSVLEMVLMSLIGSMDTIMVGTIGPSAIAAVGLVGQPRMLMLCILFAMNIGVTAVVARRKGEGRQDEANRTLRNAIVLILAVSIVMMTLGLLFSRQLMLMAGAKADTIADAETYFRILMYFLPVNALSMGICAALRGVGNTRTTMYVNITSNVVNVIFNYFLINGIGFFPRLEVKGAAIATVTGFSVGMLFALYTVFSRRHGTYLQLHWRDDWRLNRNTIRSILKVGGNAMLEQVALRIGFFLYARIVAELGTLAFAAHQIGMQFLNLSFTFGDGIGVAGTSLVGQMLGRKRPDLAQMYGNIAQRIAMTTAIVLALLILSFRYPLVSLFVSQQSVVNATASIMLILALFQPFQTSSVVMSGALRGAGDTKYVAKVMLVCVTGIRPVLSFLAVYVITHFFTPLVSELPSTALSSLTIFDHWTNQIPIVALMGAWCASLVDMIVRMSCVLRRFNSGKWHNIQV